MNRNRQKPQRPLDPDELPEAFEKESERYFKDQEDLIRAVEQLGESGAGGQVNVYRQGAAGHRDIEFLDEYTPGEFSIKAVQRDYGAGIYRAHVQNSGGEMVANKAFKVGKPRRGEVPASQAVTLNAPAPGSVNDTATILAAIKDGFATIAASLHQPQPKGLGVEETIKLIAAINSMHPPAAHSPKNGADDDMIGRFSKFLEVVEDIRGPVGSDGEVSLLKVAARALDKIAEPLGDVLANVAQRRLAKNPAAAAALGDVLATTTGAEAGAIETGEPMDFSAQLKMFLPMIIAQAAADNDPTTYADMLFDNVPLPEIQKWAGRADWFEVLEQLDPRVTPYREWFTELRNIVVEGLTPEPVQGTKAAESKGGDGATPGGAKPSQ